MVEDNKYAKTYNNNPYFALFSDDACTKKIEIEAECEPSPCSGNGSVMNIIMLTILIISFMI